MSTEQERLHILEMVDKQQITVEQAVELLDAISNETVVDETKLRLAAAPSVVQVTPNGHGSETEIPQPAVEPVTAEPIEASEADAPVVEDLAPEMTRRPSFDPAQTRWRNWWWVPMGVGIAITVCGALFMYLAWQASGLGFWFVAACLPFLLGVTFMGLAWASRKSRWLHIRVHQAAGESPQRIAISLPLPLRPLAWVVRMLRPYIPRLQQTGLDELILALEMNPTGQPIYIEVNDGDEGEHVEVYFG